jgi:hypothetical protein
MTRNISETNVINCYWMKLCNMVKILICLVCCVNCIYHVLHKKRSNSTPQHEVTFYRGHRLHGYNPKFPWKLYKEEINENIRLRKMPSVLLLQVHINTMPLLLLVFCTVISCYTFRYINEFKEGFQSSV